MERRAFDVFGSTDWLINWMLSRGAGAVVFPPRPPQSWGGLLGGLPVIAHPLPVDPIDVERVRTKFVAVMPRVLAVARFRFLRVPLPA